MNLLRISNLTMAIVGALSLTMGVTDLQHGFPMGMLYVIGGAFVLGSVWFDQVLQDDAVPLSVLSMVFGMIGSGRWIWLAYEREAWWSVGIGGTAWVILLIGFLCTMPSLRNR